MTIRSGPPRAGRLRPAGRPDLRARRAADAPRSPRPRSAAVVVVLAACSLLDLACAPTDPARSGPTVLEDSAPCPSADGRGIAGVPDVSLPCLTGTGSVTVSHLHGRPEIINIWASWCAPCRDELPMLEREHDELGDRVLFLGVDVRDSREHALAFLAAAGVSFPQVFDTAGLLPLRLGLRGVPNTLFVDGSGAVVARVIGRLDEKALANAVGDLGFDRSSS